LNLKKKKKKNNKNEKRKSERVFWKRLSWRRMRAAVVLLALATFVVCSEANVKAEGEFMPWSL
jgi:hypothetical protein